MRPIGLIRDPVKCLLAAAADILKQPLGACMSC